MISSAGAAELVAKATATTTAAELVAATAEAAAVETGDGGCGGSR